MADEYNVSINAYHLTIDGPEGTKYFSLNSLTEKFYKTRKFPLAGMAFPSVMVYTSSPFIGKNDNTLCLIIFSKAPSLVTDGNDEQFYIPWLHTVAAINVSSDTVDALSLFVSDSQITDIDDTTLWVPNVDTKLLGKNELSEQLFGSEVDFFGVNYPIDIDFRKVKSELEYEREALISKLIKNLPSSVVKTSDTEEFKNSMDSFFSDMSVNTKVLVDHTTNENNSSQSFYELISDIYINSKEVSIKEAPKEYYAVKAKPSSWTTSTGSNLF